MEIKIAVALPKTKQLLFNLSASFYTKNLEYSHLQGFIKRDQCKV